MPEHWDTSIEAVTRQEQLRQQAELDMEAQRTRQMEVELEREAQNFTRRSAVEHHHWKL